MNSISIDEPIQTYPYRGPKLGCSPEEFAAYLQAEYGHQSPFAGDIYMAIQNGQPVPYYTVGSLPKGFGDRHLSLMRLVAQNPGITCKAMSKQLGIGQSTVNELLLALRRCRWVSRTRSNKVQPYQYFPNKK